MREYSEFSVFQSFLGSCRCSGTWQLKRVKQPSSPFAGMPPATPGAGRSSSTPAASGGGTSGEFAALGKRRRISAPKASAALEVLVDVEKKKQHKQDFETILQQLKEHPQLVVVCKAAIRNALA